MSEPRSRWGRAIAAFVLFGGVGLVFFLGAGVLGLSGPRTARTWLVAAHGPMALPIVVLGFAVLAFLGAPQFVLIAATVAAYGPWQGLAYSWIGTMVSALVGFGMTRAWGGGLLSAAPGAQVGRLIGLIARNGFLASLVIRLVPFAPFVVVNMAAGLTGVTLLDFAAGTGVGILPKIVLTAVAGASVARLFMGGGWPLAIGLLVLAGILWLGAGVLARRWIKPKESKHISSFDASK